MKNNSAKKIIALYYILSLALTLPVLIIPLWFIDRPIWIIVYCMFFYIYARMAVSLIAYITILPSLYKELDAEKYAAIITTKPFRAPYSYKLALYLATGDYQTAYNMISSLSLKHKSHKERVYGHLWLCRICFERGDYEGLKDSLDQIENYLKYNPSIKLGKHDKAGHEFYRAFLSADYVSACSISEKIIEKYSKKKSYNSSVLIRQYQLAVTKKVSGDTNEATALFEKIRNRAPKLFLSTLAQRQLEYISGTLEETAPEPLEVTENISGKPSKKLRIFRVFVYLWCLVCLILLIISEILLQLDKPKFENENLEYEQKIESVLYDDYTEYQILGYIDVYPDLDDREAADSVFLVESDGKIDLHTLYREDEELGNNLNVKDIQVDKTYVYENVFSKKIEFVLTKKKYNIPNNAKYYCEIDGYYFCLIGVSDS